MTDETFMAYVQNHERAWGMDTYPGRPRLDEILNAWIVAFWYPTRRREPGFRITLHRDIDEIQQHVTELVLHSNTRPPERRLARLFVNKKQVKVKGVRLVFEQVSERKK